MNLILNLVLFFVFHHIFFVPLQLDFLEADFLVIQIYLCHQHQGLIFGNLIVTKISFALIVPVLQISKNKSREDFLTLYQISSLVELIDFFLCW